MNEFHPKDDLQMEFMV